MARICKVLVVEDDDAVRHMLGDVFDDEGYHFTLVKNSLEMRGALERDEYEVAIIDVSLRGSEDGLKLAELAVEYGCGVILTSGDPAQVARAGESEWRFLPKPFRVQNMIALVDQVLKETEARCIRRPRPGNTVFPIQA